MGITIRISMVLCTIILLVFVAFFYGGLGCALALAGVVFVYRFITFKYKVIDKKWQIYSLV